MKENSQQNKTPKGTFLNVSLSGVKFTKQRVTGSADTSYSVGKNQSRNDWGGRDGLALGTSPHPLRH